MAETLAIEDLKLRHEKLYDEALQKASMLRRAFRTSARTGAGEGLAPAVKSDESQAFLREVNFLLENLTRLSSQVRSFEDYRWISHTAVKWQNVFTFLDVPKSVKLDPPSGGLLPPPGVVPAALTEQELCDWTDSRAEWFGFTRRARKGRPGTQEERDRDKKMAFVYLASDILDGKINFVNRIAPRSFYRLEYVWLEDLKQLRAYLLWLERGGGFGTVLMKQNYCDVCDHLRNMLTNTGIKVEAAAFEPVRRHLTEYYLNQGKIDAPQNELVEYLIRNKAHQIYAKTGNPDENQNWSRAEVYVKTFYENITPAVLDGDYESTLCVLRALQCGPNALSSQCYVINAFEATLATYFLNPDLIKRIWLEAKAKSLTADSSIISEVPKHEWPLNYQVPSNCADFFEIATDAIRFRGVMSNDQRESLVAGLTDEHRQMIEELYERSRSVCQEATL